MEGEPTRVLIGVNESTIKGYPHASISSKGAFDWVLKKIIRSNISGFKILFLHVQVPDEDGNFCEHLFVYLLFCFCFSVTRLFLINEIPEVGLFWNIYLGKSFSSGAADFFWAVE